ncbi:Phytochrome-like protein cph1 [Thermoflexales bacterium]|nr:Phytochrome-like protein cph1 [Thermoflexales bacterium]
MLERLTHYLRPPIFPDDEDKTFTASLLHVILWAVLVGVVFYTLANIWRGVIQPDQVLKAWLYVALVTGLMLGLLFLTRRGKVQLAAVGVNAGLWIIMTLASYFYGGVLAPAYGGYIVVVMCTCLLVSWQWGILTVVASVLVGVFFLGAELPDASSTYSPEAVWSANATYLFTAALLLGLALRSIKRASSQARHEAAERLKTEQALRHSEHRFRAIFDSVNDAIFVHDLNDGRILDVNKTMCEMYRCTPEEARQLGIEDLSSGEAPYTGQEGLAWMQRAAAGQPQIFEWRAKDRTGRLFWVEVNMRRAAIDGQVRILVVVRDVSARKETEAALRREKRFAEDIINSLPGIFYMYNERGELVRWNKLSELVTGYSADELLGKSILDFLASEEQAQVVTRFTLAMEEGAADGEGELVTKDGQLVPYYFMSVRTELDDQVYLIGFGIDLSFRRQAEREVRQREAYLRSILDNFPYLVWLKDTTGRFLAVNEVFAQACGQPDAQAVVGKTDLDVWPRELAEKYRADDQRVMEARVQKSAEEIIAAEGVERWFETYKSPLFDGYGNVSGTAGFSRDITERKQAAEHDQLIRQGLRAVIEATQELLDCADLDTLYRHTVELGRERLGLERCGLHLLDESQQFLVGTYGTDDQGRTTDERAERVPVEERSEIFTAADQLWTVLQKPFSYWQAGANRVLPESGWIAVTPIRSRRRRIGVLYNDTAISHAPLHASQQEMTAVYCSLLGGLIDLKRTEADLTYERDRLQALMNNLVTMAAAAEQARDLLQALMDNIPDTIYFKDTASRFVHVNRAQAQLLGALTPDEVIGKTDADFFSADLSQMFLTEEQRLMSSGEPILDRMEYNPTAEGRPRWLSATKVPLKDRTNKITGLVGISRNVTDRILAEQREQLISQGLRAVIEAADELIGCAELDLLYRRVVELGRERLGLERCGLFLLEDPQTLRGTYGTDDRGQTTDERAVRLASVDHPELNPDPKQFWTLIQGDRTYWDQTHPRVVGQGWIASTLIRSHERTLGLLYNDAAISQTAVNEAQQEVVTVYCSLLGNIIERKHAEQALRESEATMRALLDAIPDAIFRFDAHGAFQDFVPGKSFVSRLPSIEFLSKPFAQALPPEMAQQLADNLQWVLEKGEPRLYETTLQLDEQRRYYESRLVKMSQGDVLGMVRDVTDRKAAELALQQREAYLRAILDNFPYWFWLKDTAGRYLAANRTLAQALGFSQVEELIGKTDWEVVPTVAAKFSAADQEVIDSRSQKFMEEIVIDGGTEKWFETFKSPIFDVQGNVIGTAGFAHDVTARRQAEAAIRESEALFRYLADNAPALIAMSDENTVATYLNRAWREFRGDVPALPLDDWSERIHPDDRRRYLHEYRSALHAQRKFIIEYRLRRSDGQYRWLFDTVVPRYTANERFAGFIGIAIDITDRKNAEEALRRSESRLRLLTDNMVDSINQLDAQQRLVYASPSVERLFGHSVRDLLGRPVYEFVHPEDTSRLYHQILLATELHTSSLRLEYRYRHAAGHYLWVESEVRLLYDEHNNFQGAVFGSRDISARKQAEAEREQLITELEDKNAELERFTYTVSHDLKSPLITIRGFLGFLEKDAALGNRDRLHADIARIVEATTRMQQLLDELLELSRLGRMNSALEEVSFETVVREAVALVQGRITARGAQVEIAADLPPVYGDRVRLVEVVQNLVDNAVKFMGDQPEPHVTIGLLGVERSGMPIFFVRDNGLGIEPQYHERIFGLFNKLDVKSEGTGVGLALVKRIVDLHGGHIWVESGGAGQGATFFFTLPRPRSASLSKTA